MVLDKVAELSTLTTVPDLVLVRYGNCHHELLQKTILVLADSGRTVCPVDKVLHDSRREPTSEDQLFDHLCVCDVNEGRILQELAELYHIQVALNGFHIAGIVVQGRVRLVLCMGDARYLALHVSLICTDIEEVDEPVDKNQKVRGKRNQTSLAWCLGCECEYKVDIQERPL